MRRTRRRGHAPAAAAVLRHADGPEHQKLSGAGRGKGRAIAATGRRFTLTTGIAPVRSLVRPVPGASKSLMRPRLAAPEGKIVGIGRLTPRRLLRLDHLIGDALALAIGDGVFLGVEAKGELLLHIAGRGPAHQGLDRPRLLRLVIELPFPGLGPARLHRVFGGLKNACGHGWWGPQESAT